VATYNGTFTPAFLSLRVIPSHELSKAHLGGLSCRNPDFIGQRTGSRNDAAALPQACPSCRSAGIVTTAKIPSTNSYWRCVGCGEIWTPARRQTQTFERWRR
jgi:hypothetical protein